MIGTLLQELREMATHRATRSRAPRVIYHPGIEPLEQRLTLSASGLVSWWTADGTAADAADGNHGTLIGASFSDGRFGQAFDLDGVNDYVNVPTSATIDGAFSESASFAAWVYWDGSSFGRVIATGDSSFANRFYQLSVGNLGEVVFAHRTVGSPSTVAAVSTTNLTSNTWHHVVGVREFGNAVDGVKVYVDGALSGSAADNGLTYAATTRSLSIGASFSSSGFGGFFPGKIDEVRVYDRALTPSEIGDLANEPHAEAGGSYSVRQGDAIQLDASGTVDLDQDPATLTYEWDLDGDGTFAETGAAATRGDEVGIAPTYSAVGAPLGSVTVDLRVTDSTGLSTSDTATIYVIEPPSLVSWWEAEDNVLDSVGTNHGSLVNGATFDTGQTGRGFSLDGVDDFVRVPPSSTIDGSFTKAMTFAGWVNWDGTHAGHVISTGDDIASQANRFHRIAVTSAGQVFFSLRTIGDPSTVTVLSAI